MDHKSDSHTDTLVEIFDIVRTTDLPTISNQCNVYGHWITTILAIKEKHGGKKEREREEKGHYYCRLHQSSANIMPTKKDFALTNMILRFIILQ